MSHTATPKISWTCRIISPDKTHDHTLPATVPGCIHTDLLRAGIISDPFYRMEAEKVQWIEACDVTYTGEFTLDELPEFPELIFMGLDCYAAAELNGELLGNTDNMFIRYSFDVADKLRLGKNIITVKFRSPIREVEGRPQRNGAFTRERMYTRRIQCTYGWDWVGRFVTMGIWRPVELVSRRPDMLCDGKFGTGCEGIYIHTESINKFGAKVGLSLDFEGVSGGAWVEMNIASPDGKTVWSKRRRILTTTEENRATLTEHIDIAEAKLWYPAGYGDQPLYTLTCTVTDENDSITDIRTSRFGIRTVEIIEHEDAPGSDWAALAEKIKGYDHLGYWDKNEGSSRFCLLVNGVEIFCQGANWVPSEPFPSNESKEKVERLVSLAREAGVNMLRIWGGGVFGSEALYSACDRAGILLTQDFLMACGSYPEEDPEFLSQLRLEAEEAALALRNHPSLVWWSGDNENAILGHENLAEYQGRRAALCAIGPVLERLDPHRRFLPSSPYGGTPYASALRGTTHNTQFLGEFFKWIREADNNGAWHTYREYFDRYLDRFTAEQPALGMPFVSTLRKFMTDEDIFGVDTTVSEYHTKTNPGLGAITIYGYIDRLTSGIFGDYKDGHDKISKMQLLHCEWIRLSMELFRRNAWYSSGIVYWMWNDCWPAANGWAIVDYYAMPKPAYYAFMRTAKPIIASIVPSEEGRTRVYVSYNGVGERAIGTLTLYRRDLITGVEDMHTTLELGQNAGETACVLDIPALPMSDNSVLICDLEANVGCDRAFSLPAGHNYADTPLDYGHVTVISEDEGSITLRAERDTPFAMADTDKLWRGFGEYMKSGEIRTFCSIEL